MAKEVHLLNYWMPLLRKLFDLILGSKHGEKRCYPLGSWLLLLHIQKGCEHYGGYKVPIC